MILLSSLASVTPRQTDTGVNMSEVYNNNKPKSQHNTTLLMICPRAGVPYIQQGTPQIGERMPASFSFCRVSWKWLLYRREYFFLCRVESPPPTDSSGGREEVEF